MSVDKQIKWIMIGAVIVFFASLGTCTYTVHQAGGWSQLLIDTGIEIKRIQREIEEGEGGRQD